MSVDLFSIFVYLPNSPTNYSMWQLSTHVLSWLEFELKSTQHLIVAYVFTIWPRNCELSVNFDVFNLTLMTSKWFHINQIKPNEFRKPQNSPNGHLVLYCYTANWILALHSHQRKNKPLMGVGLPCSASPYPTSVKKKVSNQA